MSDTRTQLPDTRNRLTLISHSLCPYVQRAAIVLSEKGEPFERRDIDLSRKPDWFLQVSPLGKTPVLLVGQQPIFESAVICEYLDETVLPRLHPNDPLRRAVHRGWMEFGSALLGSIAAFYSAGNDEGLMTQAAVIRSRLEQLETAIGEGPFFGGASFSLVDAVYGPAFRYFDVFDAIEDWGFWHALPKVTHWRKALAERPSVSNAVAADYSECLTEFLRRRESALSRRIG